MSRLIDQRYGVALKNWSGDLDELRGLATLLPQVWKHQPPLRGVHRTAAVPHATREASRGEPPETKEAAVDSGRGKLTVGPLK